MPNKERLIHLKSYAALPEDLRRAVLAHVQYGVPGPEACALAGRANGKRDWHRPGVQKVIEDYRAGSDDTDWIARLAEVGGENNVDDLLRRLDEIPTPKPENAPGQKTGTPAPPAEPRTPISQPGEQAQNSPLQTQVLTGGQEHYEEPRCTCGLVLCNCYRPDVEAQALLDARRSDPEAAARDFNRQFTARMFNIIEEQGTDEDERHRLVGQYIKKLEPFF